MNIAVFGGSFDPPHIGHKKIVEEALKQDEISLGVSINGKKRTEISVSASATKDEILSIAKEKAQKWIAGKNIIKEIVVPNRLVNLVLKI